MCVGKPAIAICACGASYAACDIVEALCHITSDSGNGHYWAFIQTAVFTAGRDIFHPNPTDYHDFLLLKYAGRKVP